MSIFQQWPTKLAVCLEVVEGVSVFSTFPSQVAEGVNLTPKSGCLRWGGGYTVEGNKNIKIKTHKKVVPNIFRNENFLSVFIVFLF